MLYRLSTPEDRGNLMYDKVDAGVIQDEYVSIRIG